MHEARVLVVYRTVVSLLLVLAFAEASRFPGGSDAPIFSLRPIAIGSIYI
jgi:hypothetical protein